MRLYSKHGTGLGGLAINDDRASTTAGRIAADMGASQTQYIANPVYEKQARIDLTLVDGSVDGDANMMGAHAIPPPVRLPSSADNARASALRSVRTVSVRTIARLYSAGPRVSLVGCAAAAARSAAW